MAAGDIAGNQQSVSKLEEGHLGAAAVLTLFLFLATVATYVVMALTPFYVAGCGDSCDFETLSFAGNAFFISAVTPLVVAVAGSYFLSERGWWVLIAPIAGFLLLGGLFAIFLTTARSALQL